MLENSLTEQCDALNPFLIHLRGVIVVESLQKLVRLNTEKPRVKNGGGTVLGWSQRTCQRKRSNFL